MLRPRAISIVQRMACKYNKHSFMPSPIPSPIPSPMMTAPNSVDNEYLAKVTQTLQKFNTGLSITNPILYIDALRVGSAKSERMEFLGDAVINIVAAHMVYQSDPNANEGVLTRRRSDVVRGTYLASLCVSSGVNELLPREARHNVTPKILEDAMESFVAAIFLDNNNDLESCREWIQNAMRTVSSRSISDTSNTKSRVKQWCKRNGKVCKSFVSKTGNEFTCTIEIDQLHVARYRSNNGKQMAVNKAFDIAWRYIEMIKTS